MHRDSRVTYVTKLCFFLQFVHWSNKLYSVEALSKSISVRSEPKLCKLYATGNIYLSNLRLVIQHIIEFVKLKVKMIDELTFSTVDYVVFGSILAVSFGIGIYQAFKSSSNNEDYVMGGHSIGIVPMAISLCASFNSAYMILGEQILKSTVER